ncbi:DUF5988 family protein [Nonomuraea angiospora]|uniref:Uncharacterized protein n=1 Tax=Nonomuraea angiospora TaxID=46172 RepID=A0ABR9M3W8_9ACTN|nr:DUF5988 family protein [Nonomuraea angiospora]MBE1587036.1 hypothetical protein [Nonomuraea angiospora]
MSKIKVMLVGGPNHLPAEQRVVTLAKFCEKIKLPFGSGYEHFLHKGERTHVDGQEVPAYHWIMRTAIAE